MNNLFELRDLSTNQRIKLDKPEVVLGRHVDCDIVLDNDEASRQHAKLLIQASGITVEDMGSTNGTYLNTREVRRATAVNGGDIIAIGNQSFLVLTPQCSGDTTIFGARIANEASSFVIDKSDTNHTSMRMAYPAPPGWQASDAVAFEQSRNSQDDQILSKLLRARGADVGSSAAALLVTGGRSKHSLFVLPRASQKTQWSIGRGSGRDITIDELTVSSDHATLALVDGGWSVEDKESTNGIKVNGVKTNYSKLKPGDKVQIGDVELLFRPL
jgi:pSer/pThr/pTyr-binding forkhead associated (FHA) protein